MIDDFTKIARGIRIQAAADAALTAFHDYVDARCDASSALRLGMRMQYLASIIANPESRISGDEYERTEP